MWNDQLPPYHNSGYPPPPGAPGGFGFSSPQIPSGGYNSPSAPPGGYSSPPPLPGGSGGYGPPLGPPGGSGGYAPPHGGYAPPPRPSPGTHVGSYVPPPGPPGGPGSYVPPQGPPGAAGSHAPSYVSPPGPPPNSYGMSRPGPLPSQGGYPGQQYNQSPESHGSLPPGSSYPGQYPTSSGAPPMPPSQVQYYGPQFQDPNNQMQQPFFQYSQCSGKKKALCIGINYIGQRGELRGCHNDVHNLVEFLCYQFGYKREDIVTLTDDKHDLRQVPTRANIIDAMHWLVRDARPNDSLFFHYSGHGGQTKDLDGDEADGFDEVIYPVDFEQSGHIVDDDMHMIMVKPLPPGCRLTAIFDSCHSGTALDLPYVYSTEGILKEPNLLAQAGQGLFSTATSYVRGDMSGVMNGVTSLFKAAAGNPKKAEEYSRRTRTSPADAISWSGCKDSQTSADTVEAGQATGAMSYAFIRALSQNPHQTYRQLLNSLRDILRTKYSQKPQLSSSHPMDTNILFIA